ncbi:MAG: hypothetical protein H6642_06090 [Caldilineaceae bacterium]|nr:hypothetical protein [Caldilineaceae bacterium]MCB9137899.1 hypothetical protein [Caldilineaceae bacterium]
MERAKWWKAGLLAVTLFVLLFSFIQLGRLWSLRAVERTSADFLNALVARDYDMAYAVSDDLFKQQVGSAADLRSRLETSSFILEKWRISRRGRQANSAEINGSAQFIGGRTGDFTIILARTGGVWSITGFSVDPADP